MRKLSFLVVLICLITTNTTMAQQKIVVHSEDESIYYSAIDDIDDIKLIDGFSNFNLNDNSNVDIPISIIDSLTFTTNTPDLGQKIYIIYNNDDVTIINPFSTQGIMISASGADVNVSATSGIANIEYTILGYSEDGSLSLDSDENIWLNLNNLNLTNTIGAAITITGGIATTLNLVDDTANTLSDASTNAANATLVTDGSYSFEGAGILNISGLKKHAILSDGQISIEGATVNVLTAVSDGFHSEGFMMDSGTITIEETFGDGIDAGNEAITINSGNISFNSESADVKAIKSDGIITINGGDFDFNLEGDQSKGFSSSSTIDITGGNFELTISGAAVLEESGSGFDPSYSTAFKSDEDINISNATINIDLTDTASGSKGFSADGNITINSGDITVEANGDGTTYTNESGITDSYTSSCIKSDLDTTILGGSITLTNNGTGGKGINADGEIQIGTIDGSNDDLTLNVTTTGNRFYVSGSGQNTDYANPKAVKAEGNLTVNSGTITINCTQSQEGGEGLESKNILTINGGLIEIETYDDAINASSEIIINGGTTYCKSRGNDGIDSNGTMTVNGGFTISSGARAPEAGLDCDNSTFKITGGILIGTGGNTSNPTANVSTQRSLKFTTTQNNHFRIATSDGTEIVAFKVPAFTGTGGQNNAVILFSDEDLANGTYTLQRGGTISSGTDFHGYVTGGTYSGGTTTNFTINSMVTTIN